MKDGWKDKKIKGCNFGKEKKSYEEMRKELKYELLKILGYAVLVNLIGWAGVLIGGLEIGLFTGLMILLLGVASLLEIIKYLMQVKTLSLAQKKLRK